MSPLKWRKTVWAAPWGPPVISYTYDVRKKPTDDGGNAYRVLIEERTKEGAWVVLSDRRAN